MGKPVSNTYKQQPKRSPSSPSKQSFDEELTQKQKEIRIKIYQLHQEGYNEQAIATSLNIPTYAVRKHCISLTTFLSRKTRQAKIEKFTKYKVKKPIYV